MQLGYERENPAFYACEFNKVDILEYLIKGVDIIYKRKYYRRNSNIYCLSRWQ
jgi:hypothetical protein